MYKQCQKLSITFLVVSVNILNIYIIDKNKKKLLKSVDIVLTGFSICFAMFST